MSQITKEINKIEQRVKIKYGKKPEVHLSLEDWRQIQDIILELSSPKLLKSIKKAREDYQNKRGILYQPNV